MPRLVLRVQGAYYLVTGLWPLVSLRTFEWVTGPKVDDWLVIMVGLLAAVIGLVLLVATRRPRPPGEAILLGLGSALSFAAVDTWFALAGRIRPIYLADAVVELLLVGALVVGLARSPGDA
ncbi:MAG TPA: hypothetical protein VF041_21340 [Gemmatimonadaceae bacterium]